MGERSVFDAGSLMGPVDVDRSVNTSSPTRSTVPSLVCVVPGINQNVDF